jgi:hypothetical protein
MPDRTELLKIKLDMVYRNKDRAASQIRFEEQTVAKTNA